jgi:hypothetical protein
VNRCKDCKFWGEEDQDIPGQYDHACCHEKLNGDYNSAYSSDSIASYELIGMGPEFGCIHWEAK